MAETDVMPAAALDETEDDRRKFARLPLPDAMPPASIGTAPAPIPPPTAGMPPAPITPAQPPTNANPAPSAMPPGPTAAPVQPVAQPPQLHGWRKALDVVGSMFPIGRAIEEQVPGTPQNFDVQQAKQAARAAQGQTVRLGEQNLAKGQQEIEKGASAAQFDTPEKRQAYLQGHPDQFQGASDFEKNDFVLAGKFPQREPPAPKEDKKIDEGYNAQGQRVIQYQRPDGTVYNRVNPDILKAAPEDANKLAAEIEAQVGPKPTTPEFAGKKYPTVAAAQLAWGKAAEGVKNDEAAAGANARGQSYGRNRPVQVVDTWNGNRPVTVSAGEAEDNPERYATQSGAERSLPKEALINDIRTSAENVKSNLSVLDSKGLDRATLAAALANPASTAQAYMQALPRGALDDKGQQFVTDLFNLREQAMALRSVLGMGAGSEDMRNAIIATLPGVASPSSKFGTKQIDNLLKVLDRLERGIPTVPLNKEGNSTGGGGAATGGGFAAWKAKKGQ